MIKHISQTLENNCTSTCLAMILGEPVEKVTEEFHEKFMAEGEDWTEEYLSDVKGIAFCSPVSDRDIKELRAGRLQPGFAYILTVASLNYTGGLHSIVVECLNNEWNVLDPAKGTGDKFYDHFGEWGTEWSDDPGALHSWIVEQRFSEQAIQEYRRRNGLLSFQQ